jgi:HD superfamily phosphodiesterase
MNTEAARKLAEDRHRFMEQFLLEYQKETDMNTQTR